MLHDFGRQGVDLTTKTMRIHKTSGCDTTSLVRGEGWKGVY